MTDRFLPVLVNEASRPFLAAGRFAYYFARGKISSDCIFAEILRRGVLADARRLLDLGCGQGYLFAWLLAAEKLHAAGQWPADWPPPPRPTTLRGYELMPRDVQRAARVFGVDHPVVSIRQGDVRAVDFGQADVISMLDVLHYIEPLRQEELLARIRAALPPGGLFLTRVGDAAAGLPYRVGHWIDHAVTFMRGHHLPRLHGRPLTEWVALLRGLDFSVDTVPMSDGQPFANFMLLCHAPVARPAGPAPHR